MHEDNVRKLISFLPALQLVDEQKLINKIDVVTAVNAMAAIEQADAENKQWKSE